MWLPAPLGAERPGALLTVLLAALLCTLPAANSGDPPASATRVAVEVTPRDAAELALVLEATDDVWSESAAPGQPVVVVLTPPGLARIAALGIPHRVVVADIDAAARAERARLAGREIGATTSSQWFAEYRDLIELGDFLDRLVEHNPRLASLRRLGTSIDGWPIRALEISRGGPTKIAINGGLHAREWISIMVTACIADQLVAGDGGDPRVRAILDAASFYIVPLVNPDGYLHSWNVDRYWRKNRRGGYGVDLNRNYSVAWGGRGSSDRERSQTYRGAHPFSEPESRALASLFEGEDIAAHLDFHSYSQLIIYPWHHRRTPPPDRDRFAAIADRMVTAMYAAHGERYEILPGSELRVGASGTLSDWTYGERGVLSFVVELRPPMGRGGFVLPPEQIIPACEESFAGVLELAEHMIRRR
jgi:hypothetical protein